MGICSALFYIVVLLFSHRRSAKTRVSGEDLARGSQFEHVLSLDSLVPAPTCRSSLPPGVGVYGVPVIPSRGPCSPFPQERDPSRGYTVGDSVAARNPPTKKTTGSQDGDHRVPIHGYRYQYIVPVGIGTPTQKLNLIMDTGSNVTWTQCKPCVLSRCTYYKQKNSYFEVNKSSTFSQICTPFQQSFTDCDYNIDYTDGSSSSGYYAHDTIIVGSSYQIPNYNFGCSQKSSGTLSMTMADGILGLAMGGDRTFLSQIASTSGKTFCYCIPPTDSSSGYLLLGDGARNNCRAETSSPVIDKRDYIVNLHSITVGNQTLDFRKLDPSSPYRTLIDSGTSITRLPPLVYRELRSKFQEYMSKYPKVPRDGILDTCYDLKDHTQVTLPKIVLHFDQADVTLDPAGVVSGESHSPVCLAFAANEFKDKETNIIGSTQMRKLNVLFDVEAKSIGFGKGNCGS